VYIGTSIRSTLLSPQDTVTGATTSVDLGIVATGRVVFASWMKYQNAAAEVDANIIGLGLGTQGSSVLSNPANIGPNSGQAAHSYGGTLTIRGTMFGRQVDVPLRGWNQVRIAPGVDTVVTPWFPGFTGGAELKQVKSISPVDVCSTAKCPWF
jgi:hypothetical protein